MQDALDTLDPEAEIETARALVARKKLVLDFVQVVVLARGTPPTGIGEQVPNLSFGRMQLSQSPVQALLQHTPSAVH